MFWMYVALYDTVPPHAAILKVVFCVFFRSLDIDVKAFKDILSALTK